MAALEGGTWKRTNATTLSYVVDGTTVAKISGLATITDYGAGNLSVTDLDGNTDELESDDLTVDATAVSDNEGTITSYTGTITVSDHILNRTKGSTVTLTPSNSKYKLTLKLEAEEGNEPILVGIKDAGESDSEKVNFDSKNGKITVTGNLSSGYAMKANQLSATYQNAITNATLVTVTGLAKKFTNNAVTFDEVGDSSDGSGFFTFAKAEDIDGYNESDADNYISALGTANIKATTNTTLANNGINYYLKLDEDSDGEYAQKSITEYAAKWAVKGTTATYQRYADIGYALNNDEGKATQINYTAAKTSVVATVTGLASGLDVSSDGSSVGLYVPNGESDGETQYTYAGGLSATNTAAAYGTNGKVSTKGTVSVTVSSGSVLPLSGTVKVAAGSDYTIGTETKLTATDVKTTTAEEDIWVISGSTATYKKVQLTYYTTGTNQITVTKQKDLYTFLTVKNLNATALAEMVATGAGLSYASNTYPRVIKEIDALKLTNIPAVEKKSDTKYDLANNATKGTVTIDGSLLNAKNVTIGSSDKFKIAVDESLAPKFNIDEYKWSLSGTTATLKGEIQGGSYEDSDGSDHELVGGYTVSDDGRTLTYTKAAKNQTLATITGLKSGTKLAVKNNDRVIGFGNNTSDEDFYGVTASYQNSDDSDDALTYYTASDGDYAGKLKKLDITVSKNVLGTGKVAIKSNFFKLAVDQADASDDVHYVLGASGASTANIGWHGSLGQTAILKKTKPEHYIIDSLGSAITYQKPGTAATNLATITGLNKNITEEDIRFDTITGAITLLDGYAVDKKDIKITNAAATSIQAATGGISSFYLQLGDDSDLSAPELSSQVWEQASNGNVTYKAKVTAGYKVGSDSLAIYYTPDGNNTTLVNLTGLKKGLVKVGGSSDGSDEYEGVSLDQETGVLTLKLAALNNADVELKTGNYSISLASDVPNRADSSIDKSWVINGDTAVFKNIGATAYYDFDTKNDKKIKYHGVGSASVAKNYITIKGLNSGLIVNPSDATDIGYYSDDTYVSAIKMEFDSQADSLGTVNVLDIGAFGGKKFYIDSNKTNTTGNYSISLAKEVVEAMAPSSVGDLTWSISNGTAVYKGKINEYYTQADEKTINYTAGKDNATIATIKGLNKDLKLDTNFSASGMIKVGNEWSDGLVMEAGSSVITIANQGILSDTTDATVTTAISLGGGAYTFELGDAVNTYDKVQESDDAVWEINTNKGKTELTRSILSKEHYDVVGSDSNIIKHYADGSIKKQLAKVTGIASGLGTIQGGEIRGITISEEEGVTPASGGTITFNDVSVINVGQSIILTDLDTSDDYDYTLDLGSGSTGIPVPEDTVSYKIPTPDANSSYANLQIYAEKTAGYSVAEGASAINYLNATYDDANTRQKGDKLAEIQGISKDLTVDSNGLIDSIVTKLDDNDKTVTFYKDALITGKKVNFVSGADNNKGNFKLATGSDVPKGSTTILPGWQQVIGANNKAVKGAFVLYSDFAISGFKANDAGSEINPQAPSGSEFGVTAVASITGLNSNATVNADNYQIDGIDLASDGTIIISKAALGDSDVKLEVASGKNYKLVLNNSDDSDEGYVSGSLVGSSWSFATNTGTLTYKQVVTAGYSLAADSLIAYAPNNTITSTLTNLSKENISLVDNDSDGLYDELTDESITFEDGVFTISKDTALAHKQVKLTTKASKGTYKYELDLADEVEADAEAPIWVKKNTDTKATLTQKTASGYTLSDDKQQVNYSSDPTTKTIATVTGLLKTVAAGTDSTDTDTYGKIAGLSIGTVESDGTFTEATDSETGNVIKIDNRVLTNTKVALGKSDNYTFLLDEASDSAYKIATESVSANGWTVKNTTAIYSPITTAYYEADSTGKAIDYHAQTAGTGLVTLTGLAKNLEVNTDGSINGITFGTGDDTNVITLSEEVLGTSTVSVIGADYKVTVAPGVIEASETGEWDDITEWVGNGSTYTFKTYDKGYYKVDSVGTSISYTAATKGTTYASIAGLSVGLITSDAGSDTFDNIGFAATDASDATAGGVITLSDTQLDGKTVKLTTSGNFSLSLATSDLSTIYSDSLAWTTSGTNATLKGTIGKGYALSEDAKTVNYYSTDKTGQKIATVSGIKSKATISTDDMETSDGITTVTLDKNQLGTTKVTINGDYFKLAVDSDSESKTDDPKWVKANNATKATYTQTTYAGFKASADGKTLNYYSKTNNVDLATLNGLNKTLTAANMTDSSDDDDALVILNESTGVITLKKDALTNSKVTLGKNDPYSLALDSNDTTMAVASVGSHFIFNNGKASIYRSTTEGWSVKSGDDKTIDYTKGSDSLVAEITGLPTLLTADASKTSDYRGASDELGGLSGITVAAVSGDSIYSIKLDATALANTKTITLTNKSTTVNNYPTYRLELDTTGTNKVDSIAAGADKWTYSNGTAVLNSIQTEGYDVGLYNDSKKTQTITYYAETPSKTALAKITGIPKTMGVLLNDTGTELVYAKSDGSTATAISYNNKKITVSDDFASAVSVATVLDLTSTDYTFTALSSSQPISTSNSNLSSISSAGVAKVTQKTGKGWVLSAGDKKLTHTTAVDKELVTIKGLTKGTYTSSDITKDGTNIKVGKTALTNSDVTLTKASGVNEDYKLVLNSTVPSTQNDDMSTWSVQGSGWMAQTEWVTSGGTATYKLYDKENWYLKNDTTIKYVAPTKGTTFAAISGLNKNAASISANASSGVITLDSDDLDKKAVTLKLTTTNKTTVESLKAAVDEGNTKAKTFTLALGSDVAEELATVSNAYWDTNGTTATRKGSISKGYILTADKLSVKYQSADKDDFTLAKITGIKKDAEITTTEESDENGGKITIVKLGAEQLGTTNAKITATNGDYKLAFDESDTVMGASADDATLWNDQDDWIASNGTFTYKNYDKIHYEIDDKGTTISYVKAKDNQIHAVIGGLATSITTAMLESDEGDIVTIEGGVITLGDAALNKKDITFTDKDTGGYTVALATDTNYSTVESVTASFSGTGANHKGTWKGYQTEGYRRNNDDQTFKYFNATNAAKQQTLATVTGLKVAATSVNDAATTFASKFAASDNYIELDSDDIDTKVTIGGTAAFSFADNVTGTTITGSGSADKITVKGGNTINTAAGNDRIYITGANNSVDAGAGSDFVSIGSTGNSIMAGAGNDYFDFGNKGSNTFFYASGNGNDVIVNFNANDSIKVTSYTKSQNKISATDDGEDVIVKVNTNTITLKKAASKEFTIYDKGGEKAVTHTAVDATPNILADDNYGTTPQLSSLVKGSSAYVAEDLVATDATSLTKQSSAIAYSGSSKK